MRKRIAVPVVILLIAIAAWQLTRPPADSDYAVQIIAPDVELPNLGFETVEDNTTFNQPAEPHPEYQYERWQLDLSACYETPATITFDRIGLISELLAPERESAWAFQQVIIADVQLPDFQETRYSRSALDLAGAENDRVWLDDWRLIWNANGYELTLRDQLKLNLNAVGSTQTESASTYYQIRQDLATQIDGERCNAVLLHSFGEQLP